MRLVLCRVCSLSWHLANLYLDERDVKLWLRGSADGLSGLAGHVRVLLCDLVAEALEIWLCRGNAGNVAQPDVLTRR